jgi:hypothetical protein
MQRLPCLTQDQRDLIRVAFLVRTGSPGPLPNVDRILLWPLGHAIDALHYLRKGGRWPQLRETLRKLKTPLEQLQRTCRASAKSRRKP